MHSRFGEKVISIKLPILISQSVLGILLLVVSISSLAETTFTYQGRLSQSGEPANGIYDMRFNLFDAVIAGSLIGPTVNQTGVKVLDGVFNVMLDFGDSPFGSDPRWLRVEVKEAGGGAFVALFPRQRVGASPFAIETLAVADGAIDTAALQDNAVTTTKIADGNVFTNDLANYAVSTIKLSNEAVTRTKVANDAIGTAQIENNTVSSSDIRDGAVTNAKIAQNAIGPENIDGGLYARKGQVLYYTETLEIGYGAQNVSVSCVGDRDILVLYNCNVPSDTTNLTILSQRLTSIDNDANPARLSCSAENRTPTSPEIVTATIGCIPVP